LSAGWHDTALLAMEANEIHREVTAKLAAQSASAALAPLPAAKGAGTQVLAAAPSSVWFVPTPFQAPQPAYDRPEDALGLFATGPPSSSSGAASPPTIGNSTSADSLKLKAQTAGLEADRFLRQPINTAGWAPTLSSPGLQADPLKSTWLSPALPTQSPVWTTGVAQLGFHTESEPYGEPGDPVPGLGSNPPFGPDMGTYTPTPTSLTKQLADYALRSRPSPSTVGQIRLQAAALKQYRLTHGTPQQRARWSYEYAHWAQAASG
jgi:hypothetical protein